MLLCIINGDVTPTAQTARLCKDQWLFSNKGHIRDFSSDDGVASPIT